MSIKFDIRDELVMGGGALVGGLAAGGILGAAGIGPLAPVAAVIFGLSIMTGAFGGRLIVNLTGITDSVQYPIASPLLSLAGIVTGIGFVILIAVVVGAASMSVPLVIFAVQLAALAAALAFVSILVFGVAGAIIGVIYQQIEEVWYGRSHRMI